MFDLYYYYFSVPFFSDLLCVRHERKIETNQRQRECRKNTGKWFAVRREFELIPEVDNRILFLDIFCLL